MSFLQILWFVIIGILFSGFFFLEGYDFGVGMSYSTLAVNEDERDKLYNVIGPTWDGNEVWLITAGGALFASFPYWYASLFSGFYILLFLVLLSLIFRGVSFEFKENMNSYKGLRLWDKVTSITSFLIPFGFGVIFTALIQGMPIDNNGDIYGNFYSYINWLSLVGGIALSLLSYIHGLNFIKLKTSGSLRERAIEQLKYLLPALLVGEVLFAVLIFFYTDFLQLRTVSETIILLVIVLGTVSSYYFNKINRDGLSFISIGISIIALIAFIFNGLFPRVMVGKDGINSILIENASSTPYTLQVMTIVSLTVLPIVLAYQIWSVIVFKKRIEIN